MTEQEHYIPKEPEPIMIGSDELRMAKREKTVDQDLREKIASKGANAYFNAWDKLTQKEKDNWLHWASGILALFSEWAKENGWVELAEDSSYLEPPKGEDSFIEELINFLHKEGLLKSTSVKVAEALPLIMKPYYIKAGWRRVKE